MSMFKRTLCAASAALVLGLTATVAQAQTTTTYAYSASITLGSPAGSSTTGTPAKNKPVGIKALPCGSGTDALTFTLKYDAGKLLATPDDVVQSDSRKDVYVIFSKDSTSSGATSAAMIAQLFRSGTGLAGQTVQVGPLTAIGASTSTIVASELNANKSKTYYSKLTVASGAQTEVIFGGQISLEGLTSGVWVATVIIADSATVNFDDLNTWAAWDAVPFLLGKPWTGTVNTVCS